MLLQVRKKTLLIYHKRNKHRCNSQEVPIQTLSITVQATTLFGNIWRHQCPSSQSMNIALHFAMLQTQKMVNLGGSCSLTMKYNFNVNHKLQFSALLLASPFFLPYSVFSSIFSCSIYSPWRFPTLLISSKPLHFQLNISICQQQSSQQLRQNVLNKTFTQFEFTTQ